MAIVNNIFTKHWRLVIKMGLLATRSRLAYQYDCVCVFFVEGLFVEKTWKTQVFPEFIIIFPIELHCHVVGSPYFQTQKCVKLFMRKEHRKEHLS